MISKIRERVLLLKDKKIKFRYNGSRNQIEDFEGIITNCYKYVFLINDGVLNRSFAYSDVLIGILEIDV